MRTGVIAMYAISNDHLGRPEVVTNTSGAVVWRARNLAYHREQTVNHSGFGSLGFGSLGLSFPGQYLDAESGMADNWHRVYDPSSGRYTQSDPIGLEGGLNTYLYANANPLMCIDPYGLFGWADMPTLPQPVVNFSAGLGDGLLLGTGEHLRDLAGVDSGVDECATSYRAGGWASFAAGASRLAYAGAARVGSMVAASGMEASMFRHSLRTIFRGGIGSAWR